MRALVVLACSGALVAQQLQWQVPASAPSTTEYNYVTSFADFDGDGTRDYLRLVRVPQPYLDIASGHDGSLLWRQWHPLGVMGDLGHAGDVDRDGKPDLIVVRGQGTVSARLLEVYSPYQDRVLWSYVGPGLTFGSEVLGNLDTDGDGRPDVVTKTSGSSTADVFVFDHVGTLRYTIPCLARGRWPESLANMGDMDGDGCDDILIGCIEPSTRGVQWLVSGRTGGTIRETFGVAPGNHAARHVSNLGDIDGDGVNDYAAFPYYTAPGIVATAYSGATGAVIRSWADAPTSVVAGLDFDQDGIGDIVSGGDWSVGPNLYGRTYCWSGRDGGELWRVDVVPFAPGSGGSAGSSGWMFGAASIGEVPGSPYPAVAWLELEWYMAGTSTGRIRAFGGARAGQGPVTGTACTSSGTLPLIGVRKLGVGAANTGFRTTIAKTHPNALAALNFAFSPLPVPADLSAFGFAGCTIYVDPIATYLRSTGSTGVDRGYAAVDLPHPLSAASAGTDVVAQWLVLEPVSGAHGATQMHAIRLP